MAGDVSWWGFWLMIHKMKMLPNENNHVRFVFVVWFAVLYNHVGRVSSSWIVSAPKSVKDWHDLSMVVVECFDKPMDKDDSWFERLRWDTVGRDAARKAVYQRYVKNALRMRGSKYSILLAREESNNNSKKRNKVVGMAEMGLVTRRSSDSCKDTDDKDGSCEEKQPTIGVLCVLPEYQQMGVGRDLVAKCESLVANVWNEPVLCAEVETTNDAAIQFFQRQGFERVDKETVQVGVVVRQGRVQHKPHLVLRKNVQAQQQQQPTEETNKD